MDPFLVVIIALAIVLFVVSVYMEWLGLLSVIAFHSGPRHSGCGHRKLTPANESAMCWRCRHRHFDHALRGLHQSAHPAAVSRKVRVPAQSGGAAPAPVQQADTSARREMTAAAAALA